MPEPGKVRRLAGRASSIRSLRLNGAALRWRIQFGLKTICATLRLSAAARQEAMRSAARRRRRMPVPGLPTPQVELLEVSSTDCGRIGGRLRLTFAARVVGPVILGKESHRGGALFLAGPRSDPLGDRSGERYQPARDEKLIVRRVITQSVRVHFCFVEPSLGDGISTIGMPALVLGPYMRRRT
jgi:hypothetical protein